MAIAGRVMPVPKGDYNPGTTYDVLDIVSHNKRPWICRKPSTVGIEPTTSASEFWMLLVDVDITNADTLDGKDSTYFMSKEEMFEMFKTHQLIFRADAWVGDVAPFTQAVQLSHIKAGDEPFAFFINDGETPEDGEAKRQSFHKINYFDSEDGQIVATCNYEKPTVDFTVGFRGVFGQNG